MRQCNQTPVLTGEEIYRLGDSLPLRSCLPAGLMHSLPRLEYVRGRLALQFWYYRVDIEKVVFYLEPVYYGAVDAYTERVLELKAFRNETTFEPSKMEVLIIDQKNGREVQYLNYCAQLLNGDEVTEAQITHSQALWLDAQCREALDWLYYHSGVRPDAVRELLSRDGVNQSRHLLDLWIFQIVEVLRSKEDKVLERMIRLWQEQMDRTPQAVCRYLYRRIPTFANRLGELPND